MREDDPEAKRYAQVVGTVLAWHRCRRDLSQRALATASGVPQTSISRFETGEAAPDTFTLRQLAAGLELTLLRLTQVIEAVWQRVGDAIKATGCTAEPWWSMPPLPALVGGLVRLALDAGVPHA